MIVAPRWFDDLVMDREVKRRIGRENAIRLFSLDFLKA